MISQIKDENKHKSKSAQFIIVQKKQIMELENEDDEEENKLHKLLSQKIDLEGPCLEKVLKDKYKEIDTKFYVKTKEMIIEMESIENKKHIFEKILQNIL